uniref:(northern house mosquito) hypothetical protein n=1 Tax=Culex pipiens TaxID=7175 RepID=A0A8D8JJ70_CULPI
MRTGNARLHSLLDLVQPKRVLEWAQRRGQLFPGRSGLCPDAGEGEAPPVDQQLRTGRPYDQSAAGAADTPARAGKGAGAVPGLLHALHRLPAGQDAVGEPAAVRLRPRAQQQPVQLEQPDQQPRAGPLRQCSRILPKCGLSIRNRYQ